MVATLLVLAWLPQRRLIHFPLGQDVPPVATMLLRAEQISFETADGLQLQGWITSRVGTSRATVLVFNGNAGDRLFRAPLAAKDGLSVWLRVHDRVWLSSGKQ